MHKVRNESSKLPFQRAKGDDDVSRIMFYEIAACNLFKELQ